jgi:PKD repeat protein
MKGKPAYRTMASDGEVGVYVHHTGRKLKGQYLAILTVLVIAVSVSTVSATDFSDAQSYAYKLNDSFYGQTPISVNYTDAMLEDAGYTLQRPGGLNVTFKSMYDDQVNGTLVTYINAWNNGSSLHIHNPVRWYLPFNDNLQGAQLQQAFVMIVASYLDGVEYGEPVDDDTLIIYPAVDGYAGDTTASAWATLRADTGATYSSGPTSAVSAPLIDTSSSAGVYHIFNRGILSFNTASLPDDASITSATFGVYVTAKATALGTPAVGITGGTLTSNTSIVAGDYDGFGNVRYASDIANADIGTSSRENWTLNAAGLANISKTSYTVIYLRDSWDIDNSYGGATTKNSVTSISWDPVGYATQAYRPYLVVVFTAPAEAGFSANVTTGNIPLAVQFTDTSLWTPTNWDWYFGNGTKFSDSQNPTAVFTSEGTYSINLYVSNSGGGDWENKTNYISATVPMVADFSADDTTPAVSQTVTFTDACTGSPTAWAWYFGDENWTTHDVWTQVNATGPLTTDWGNAAVQPDGDVFAYTPSVGDVLKSTDNGSTWTVVNASPFAARNYPGFTSLADGSLLIVGQDTNVEAWRSTDDGATWTMINASTGINQGYGAQPMSQLSDGSIVFTSGVPQVYRSTDNGLTWTLINNTAPWGTMNYIAFTSTPDDVIYAMGGNNGTYQNSVWRSTDKGYTWTLSTHDAQWFVRGGLLAIGMPDNSVIMTQGGSPYVGDTWRSADQGVTWTNLTGGVGSLPITSGGYGQAITVTPNGTVVFEGQNADGTWILNTAGSSNQNPTHAYSAEGTYNVTLQCYNDASKKVTTKTSYITVGGAGSAPVAGFSADDTTPTTTQTVTFTDSSTNSPTSWRWYFTNTSMTDYQFSTSQNPTYVFGTTGTYTIKLNATNAFGFDWENKTDYLTVSAGGTAPVAGFSADDTTPVVGQTVTFTDSSTNTPTAWVWYFGNGTQFSTGQNPQVQFANAGTYTINMNASNAFGFDWENKTNYITVSVAGTPILSDFSVDDTTPTTSQQVTFTESCSGGETGYVWYFGDEDWTTKVWTTVNVSDPYFTAYWGNAANQPDGDIFTYTDADGVARSQDNGTSWTQMNATPWSARDYPGFISLDDGSLLVAGGQIVGGDTWQSTDDGVTWTAINTTVAMAAMNYGQNPMYQLTDNSIVLMGGVGDVWRSTDDGVTWTLINDSAPFAGYQYIAFAADHDDVLYASGGYTTEYQNTTWVSNDKGYTWSVVNTDSTYTTRGGHIMVAMPDKSLLIFSGGDAVSPTDTWRSTDGGNVWTKVLTTGIPPSYGGIGTVNRNGTVIFGFSATNDIYNLETAGSISQNPTHTYSQEGTYAVSLQCYNDETKNVTTKSSYITVSSGETAPVASFTVADSFVRMPKEISVTDTSTNTPTSWIWCWGDGSANSTTENPTHEYTKRGDWAIMLTVTNGAGSDSENATVRVVGWRINWY